MATRSTLASNQPTRDKSIAGCAAGGVGLPDIVTIENGEAENYWSQFPPTASST